MFAYYSQQDRYAQAVREEAFLKQRVEQARARRHHEEHLLRQKLIVESRYQPTNAFDVALGHPYSHSYGFSGRSSHACACDGYPRAYEHPQFQQQASYRYEEQRRQQAEQYRMQQIQAAAALKRKEQEQQQQKQLQSLLTALLGAQVEIVNAQQSNEAIPDSCKRFCSPQSTAEGRVCRRQSAPSCYNRNSEQAGADLHRRPAFARRRRSTGDDKDIEQFFSAVFGSPLENGDCQMKCGSSAKAEAEKKSDSSTVNPSTTSSVKAELEARLGNEYESEVRDTIQALINSLNDVSPAPLTSSIKGKAKAATSNVPVAPVSPTSKDIINAIQAIQNIEASFHILESDFVFPVNLDLTPTSSRPSSPVPSIATSTQSSLTYTARNAPIHNYTHALSSLLTQLDTIESWGNEEVRKRRKEVVGLVEGELENVEAKVEHRARLRAKRESEEVEGYDVTPADDGSKTVMASSSEPAPPYYEAASSIPKETHDVMEASAVAVHQADVHSETNHPEAEESVSTIPDNAQTTTESPVVSDAKVDTTAVEEMSTPFTDVESEDSEEESETHFLLPQSTPEIPTKPNYRDDEGEVGEDVVVIDDDQDGKSNGSGSDGENWSEVEA